MNLICGIDDKRGFIGDDSSSLNTYFELGWELVTTHLDAKYLLYKNKISNNDTIITCSGREFLYEGLFNYIITWKDYKQNRKGDEINLVDLRIKSISSKNMNMSLFWDKGNMRCPECDIDINLIKNIKFADINKHDTKNKYCCFVYRQRDHCPDRNLSTSYISELLNHIGNLNYKIFIVGYGSESLCDSINRVNVNLQEFATLINNPNCIFVLSTLTGPPHLTYFVGHNKLNNIIIDLYNSRTLDDHSVNMGNNVNFTGVKNKFFKGTPDINIIKKEIDLIYENTNM